MINFFKYPLIYPYKGNIRSTRLLGSNTLPCQSPISIEHVYLILAIRRLRRLLARPTGGSLASLGDSPPPRAPPATPTTARPLLEIRSRTLASNSLRWPWTLDLSRPPTTSEVSCPQTTSEVAASNGLKWVLEV